MYKREKKSCGMKKLDMTNLANQYRANNCVDTGNNLHMSTPFQR